MGVTVSIRFCNVANGIANKKKLSEIDIYLKNFFRTLVGGGDINSDLMIQSGL